MEEAEIFGFANEDEENLLESSNDVSPLSPTRKDLEPNIPETEVNSPKRTSPKEQKEFNEEEVNYKLL